MAILTNINNKFKVDSGGAITFGGVAFPAADGSPNQILQTDGGGQLSWVTDGGGNVTGSGTLNKVPRWTATGSNLGDGPITFSNASATATSTFGGPVTSASVYGTSRVQSDDNMFMVGGQFYMGVDDSNTDDTYRFYAASGVYYLQSRKSGTWTTYLSIGSDAHAAFSGQVSATHFDSTSTTANIFLGSVITKPGDNLGFIVRNSSNGIIGSFLRTSNTTSKLTTDNLSLGGTTAQYVRGDGSFATFSPGTGTVTGSGSATRVAFWSSGSAITSDADLYWDNTNKRLGIGTDAPGANLDVAGTTPVIRITNTTDPLGNGTVGSFEFFTKDSSTGATRTVSSIVCDNLAGSSVPGGDLVFKTSLGGGGSPVATEKMRIKDNGNVGIGTDSPDNILHIRNGDTTYASQVGADTMLFLETTNVSNALQFTSANTGQQYIMFGDDDPNAGWISYNHSDNNLNFRVNGSEKMRINSSGNVLLGNTVVNPASGFSNQRGFGYNNSTGNLEVASTTGTPMTIGRNETAAGEILQLRKESNITHSFGSTDSYLLSNVGINNTSPAKKLEISSPTSSDGILLTGDGTGGGMATGNYRSIGFSYTDTDTSYGSEMKFEIPDTSNHGGQISFWTDEITTGNSVRAMTINRSQNVGIGTTSPDYQLDIENSGGAVVRIHAGVNSSASLRLKNDAQDWDVNTQTNDTFAIYNQTTGTQPFSILPNGNVGIGDTLPTSLSANTSSLTVNSTRTDLSGAFFQKSNSVIKFQQYWTTAGIVADVASGDYFWKLANVNKMGLDTGTGALTVVGDVVAYGSPSDKRLKENIKPIKSALDKVSKLQGVTFDWKESDSILNIKEDIGFIAQDVQKVIPELVRENDNGMLSMRHQGIAPILLEAIKELKAEIEELKLNNCNCK